MSLVSHEASLVAFLGLLVLISGSNLLGLHQLGRAGRKGARTPPDTPRVSVLVPARNEERNIAACVRSLLAQDYPNSGDDTARVLAACSADLRLRVLSGLPLPPGWLGKNWACHQLGRAATGGLLLFTDADTRHDPQALRDAVAALYSERVDFLSVLPRQRMETWGERLVVPLLPWSQHTFFPIALFRRGRCSVLTTAIGQFMLFHRRAYVAVGGYERVRASVVDDLDLVNVVSKAGFRWTLLDGADRVSTRMYGSFCEAFNGFSKNLYARFRYNLPLFAFVWMWLVWVTWQPPILLILRATGAETIPSAAVPYAAVATGLGFLLWFISDLRFRVPLGHVIVCPLTVLVALVIAVRSVVWHALGRGTWKDRPLRPSRA
jgi:chlorobactene glucosyltransferase